MNPCRCGHSLFRHYDQDAGANCTACGCPEFRHLGLTDRPTHDDDDFQLRNVVG